MWLVAVGAALKAALVLGLLVRRAVQPPRRPVQLEPAGSGFVPDPEAPLHLDGEEDGRAARVGWGTPRLPGRRGARRALQMLPKAGVGGAGAAAAAQQVVQKSLEVGAKAWLLAWWRDAALTATRHAEDAWTRAWKRAWLSLFESFGETWWRKIFKPAVGSYWDAKEAAIRHIADGPAAFPGVAPLAVAPVPLDDYYGPLADLRYRGLAQRPPAAEADTPARRALRSVRPLHPGLQDALTTVTKQRAAPAGGDGVDVPAVERPAAEEVAGEGDGPPDEPARLYVAGVETERPTAEAEGGPRRGAAGSHREAFKQRLKRVRSATASCQMELDAAMEAALSEAREGQSRREAATVVVADLVPPCVREVPGDIRGICSLGQALQPKMQASCDEFNNLFPEAIDQLEARDAFRSTAEPAWGGNGTAEAQAAEATGGAEAAAIQPVGGTPLVTVPYSALPFNGVGIGIASQVVAVAEVALNRVVNFGRHAFYTALAFPGNFAAWLAENQRNKRQIRSALIAEYILKYQRIIDQIPKEWATVRFDFCPGPLYEKPLRETGGTLVIEQNGIKRIDPETVDAKRICGYKLDELVIVLQAYSVILQGFGVLMNGLDAFQDAAIRWFDGVKDECSYNPQANLDCVLRGFTITIPFDDFLFGDGGFSSIVNLLPGVDIGGS